MKKIDEGGQTVSVGKVELEVRQSRSKFTPGESRIVGAAAELETIAVGVRDNLPVLLVGDTGTGKTSYIRHLAHLTQSGFRRLNMNGSTTTEELVGHYVIDGRGDGMRWVKGVLYEAMEEGYWLLLDELNAALPEVLFALHSVMDDDHMLVVAEHEGEVVKPAEGFRLFATMNPSLEYAGTRDLNKALLSRFPIVVQAAYPGAVQEAEIVKLHVPGVDEKQLALMVRTAEDIRAAHRNGTVSFVCSSRELINWAKLCGQFGIQEAAKLAVINKCELESDRKTIEDVFRAIFGKWEAKQVMSLSEIDNVVKEMKKDIDEVKAENVRLTEELAKARGI
jgi:MoxR-like ATPase